MQNTKISDHFWTKLALIFDFCTKYHQKFKFTDLRKKSLMVKQNYQSMKEVLFTLFLEINLWSDILSWNIADDKLSETFLFCSHIQMFAKFPDYFQIKSLYLRLFSKIVPKVRVYTYVWIENLLLYHIFIIDEYSILYLIFI